MTRRKAFDETSALEKAVDLFWDQGYEAASVRELSAATGLSHSSLYNAFGDKHDVYLAALERYRVQEREDFAATLAGQGAMRPLLAGLFDALIDTLLADGTRRGSFTLNAAIELGGRDEAVAELLRRHFDEVSDLLAGRLASAQAQGEIGRRFPAEDLARQLLFGLYSLATMVKLYPDRALMEKSAELTLAMLDC